MPIPAVALSIMPLLIEVMLFVFSWKKLDPVAALLGAAEEELAGFVPAVSAPVEPDAFALTRCLASRPTRAE